MIAWGKRFAIRRRNNTWKEILNIHIIYYFFFIELSSLSLIISFIYYFSSFNLLMVHWRSSFKYLFFCLVFIFLTNFCSYAHNTRKHNILRSHILTWIFQFFYLWFVIQVGEICAIPVKIVIILIRVDIELFNLK